ncbi:Protein cornichon-like protein 4 [Rhynchospora pubera]|uniref:Protein cornichon-like protein 4 n=1 Tax=Rhynchospora pubera TaxID=906938 RepID=A0AAV8DZL2_9POAL|nr:Protein cornichon-like protein 4 [Rhynchospora pubera]KAJ4803709.1 Protein cornichon-like protein 4 [Rhynchospora pubera]
MVLFWVSSFILLVLLVISVVYQLLTLSDLERDYINAHEGVLQVNRAVYVEFSLQLIISVLFLFSGHWVMFLFCIPIIYYSAKTYLQGKHKVSEVDIFGKLNQEKTRRLVKLAMVVVPLCLSLFWLIWSALEDDDFHLSPDELYHS